MRLTSERAGKLGGLVMMGLVLTVARAAPAAPKQLAVLPFVQSDEGMAWMGPAVAYAAVSDAERLPGIVGVDPWRLAAVTDQLQLKAGPEQPPPSGWATTLAKVVGANLILLGRIEPSAAGSIHLSGQLLAADGQELAHGEATGTDAELVPVERRLISQLLQGQLAPGGKDVHLMGASAPPPATLEALGRTAVALERGDLVDAHRQLPVGRPANPRLASIYRHLQRSANALGRMAILPLDGQAQAPTDGKLGLGLGLAELLAADLTTLGLPQIDRTAISAVLVTPASGPQAQGIQLAAKQTVSGSYSIEGDRLKLEVKVIDSEAGTVLLNETAVGPKQTPSEVTRALAVKLAAALMSVLKPPAAAAVFALYPPIDMDMLEQCATMKMAPTEKPAVAEPAASPASSPAEVAAPSPSPSPLVATVAPAPPNPAPAPEGKLRVRFPWMWKMGLSLFVIGYGLDLIVVGTGHAIGFATSSDLDTAAVPIVGPWLQVSNADGLDKKPIARQYGLGTITRSVAAVDGVLQDVGIAALAVGLSLWTRAPLPPPKTKTKGKKHSELMLVPQMGTRLRGLALSLDFD